MIKVYTKIEESTKVGVIISSIVGLGESDKEMLWGGGL